MKKTPPWMLALRSSLIISFIVFCVMAATQLAFRDLQWGFIFATTIITGTSVFLVTLSQLNKFIMGRLKQVYKVLNMQVSQSTILTNDPIDDVNAELITWAEDKQQEIEELKRLSQYRRTFMGNVTHELKTPIFAADGFIHTLIDGGIEDPEINMKYLKKAAKNLDRLNQIVEDLNFISRFESDEMIVEATEFDIALLVREIYDSLEIKATEAEINLQLLKPDEQAVLVYADRSKIEQVLTNLVVNAITYGNQGGYVKVGFFDMDAKVMIEISDDGAGIDKKHHARLFERFYRVDESRSRDKGGTGLGLAIVKHIIEAHGEVINVRSDLGKGTTFSFSLKKKE